MRIISGKYGGRPVVAAKGSITRPMTDKARGALFDSVGPVENESVLDAYAGSGAIGFEALSRGAAQVVAIERSTRASQAIKSNRLTLGINWGHSLHACSVESWLARDPTAKFDLIVADPPYAQLRADVLEKLGALLNQNGTLVVSKAARDGERNLEGLDLIRQNTYGDTALGFYQLAKTV